MFVRLNGDEGAAFVRREAIGGWGVAHAPLHTVVWLVGGQTLLVMETFDEVTRLVVKAENDALKFGETK